mgnify:CR=1 FL=1
MALKANMKILAIDSDSTARQNLKNILKSLGLKNIKEATNADEALSALKKEASEDEPIEFIICENDLPEKSGLDVLAHVREDNHKKTPFLMVMNNSDQQTVLKVVKAGVNNVMVKPYSGEVLKEKIAKIFNQ